MRAADTVASADGQTDAAEARSLPRENHASPLTVAELVELYKRWFEVIPADTPELIEQAHRLRYQVYCVENPFEDRDHHPSGLEIDEYDSRSIHSLLIHRPSNMVAGTVRLILPQPHLPGLGLPIAKICDGAALQDPALFPPTKTAEISRFAISKAFRRRFTDAQLADSHVLSVSDAKLLERRVTPHLTLGLMKAVAQMSLQHGITRVCAVMEPSLLRLIRRLGIKFTPVGPLVDYHGRRQPCYSDITTVGQGLRRQRPDALEVVTDQGRYWPEGQSAASDACDVL